MIQKVCQPRFFKGSWFFFISIKCTEPRFHLWPHCNNIAVKQPQTVYNVRANTMIPSVGVKIVYLWHHISVKILGYKDAHQSELNKGVATYTSFIGKATFSHLKCDNNMHSSDALSYGTFSWHWLLVLSKSATHKLDLFVCIGQHLYQFCHFK